MFKFKFKWKKFVAHALTFVTAPFVAAYLIIRMIVNHPSVTNVIRILEWPSATLRIMWLALLPNSKDDLNALFAEYR